MNDLHLWQEMRNPVPDTSEVIPLLEELATLPMNQRLAFLGLAEWYLSHTNPKLRAAGVALLGGAQGIPAWKYLVAGLKDPEPAVQMAAVEALKRSAYYDPARWVHACSSARSCSYRRCSGGLSCRGMSTMTRTFRSPRPCWP